MQDNYIKVIGKYYDRSTYKAQLLCTNKDKNCDVRDNSNCIASVPCEFQLLYREYN